MLQASKCSTRTIRSILVWENFHPDAAAFWQRVDANSASACGRALAFNRRILVADIESCDFMAGSQDLEELRRSGLQKSYHCEHGGDITEVGLNAGLLPASAGTVRNHHQFAYQVSEEG